MQLIKRTIMAYFTYAAAVSTTPVEIWNVDEGTSPRILRISCTTADVNLELHGAIPDAANDPMVVTAGDAAKDFVVSTRLGLTKIVASTSSGTAALTVETLGI
jgi:hypothetical protein